MPRRIRWRDSEATARVLDYRDDALRVAWGRWDPRFVAGLTALLDSHAGLMGSPWDQSSIAS
jgi:hypothetical protein